MSRLIAALTEFSPSRGICLILALGMLTYGGWVILPFTAFTASTFALMVELASEVVWGGLMLLGGLTLMWGVVNKDVEWLRRGAFLGFLLWTLIGVLGTISDPTGTGFAVRATLALMHAYMYVQANVHPCLITGEVSIKDLREYVANNNGGNHGTE